MQTMDRRFEQGLTMRTDLGPLHNAIWIPRPVFAWFVLSMLILTSIGAQEDTANEPPVYTVGIGDRLGVALHPLSGGVGATWNAGPGDVLNISYHFGAPPDGEPYRVEQGDGLTVSFKYSPQLSQLYNTNRSQYIVQPEGTIVLRGLKNPVYVLDKTTTEIAAILYQTADEAKILMDPEVVVSVTPKFLKDDTLKDLFRSMELRPISYHRGTIAPDGRLSVPLIPEFPAAGRTLAEIGQELTQRYRAMDYRRVTVTAMLETPGAGRYGPLQGIMALEHGPLHVEILPGGVISLPMLSALQAAGGTPDEIGRRITDAYARLGVEGVGAAVWVERTAEDR